MLQMSANVDKENKKLLEKAITKNKTIKELSFHANSLQLPAILRNTKKITESLSRLTHLDLSSNSLPVQGAKVIAKFLEKNDTLISLILSDNNLTTKGAKALLPSLQVNTTLQELDLSDNWLANEVSDTVNDMLKNNSTLLSFDLTGNNSMKSQATGLKRSFRLNRETRRYEWGYFNFPRVEGARLKIMRNALFDTTSLMSIANCNHT